jgi:BASS family bile acid:Na+ symporter
MAEFLGTLQNLFTFAFVVSSMLAMGLSLTVGQILQTLSSARLVLLALAAKLRDRAGGGIRPRAQVIPMDEPLKIGLILMGSAGRCAASCRNSRRSPRRTWHYRGGLMALAGRRHRRLPAARPALPPPRVEVGRREDRDHALWRDAGFRSRSASSCGRRWEDAAGELQKPAAQVSNLSLVLLLVLMLGLNIENVIGLFGSGALLRDDRPGRRRESLRAICSAGLEPIRARCWLLGPGSGILPRRSSSPAANFSDQAGRARCSLRVPD